MHYYLATKCNYFNIQPVITPSLLSSLLVSRYFPAIVPPFAMYARVKLSAASLPKVTTRSLYERDRVVRSCARPIPVYVATYLHCNTPIVRESTPALILQQDVLKWLDRLFGVVINITLHSGARQG